MLGSLGLFGFGLLIGLLAIYLCLHWDWFIWVFAGGLECCGLVCNGVFWCFGFVVCLSWLCILFVDFVGFG